jgi:hypothetical protein
VKAEFARARAAGELPDAEGGSYLLNRPATPSTLTRAEVKAELARARAAGEIRDGEGGAYLISQPAGAPRDRASVRAEAMEAARTHAPDIA